MVSSRCAYCGRYHCSCSEEVSMFSPPPLLKEEQDFWYSGPATTRATAKVTTLIPQEPGQMVLARDCKALQSGVSTKEDKKMNIVKELKNLTLSSDDKLLRKYQLVDESGDLTAQGKEAIWQLLLKQNKDTLVEQLRELEKERAKKSK